MTCNWIPTTLYSIHSNQHRYSNQLTFEKNINNLCPPPPSSLLPLQATNTIYLPSPNSTMPPPPPSLAPPYPTTTTIIVYQLFVNFNIEMFGAIKLEIYSNSFLGFLCIRKKKSIHY